MDDIVCETHLVNSQTDMGNGMRFLEQHRKDVRYSYELKTWFIWDSRRWEPDIVGKIYLLAQQTAQQIYHEVYKAELPEYSISKQKWAKLSLSRQKIEAMLKLADSHVAIKIGDLDQHPMLLNVKNGILDLNTGEKNSHDRRFLLTKLIDVEYKKGEECPKWKAFLDKVIPNKGTQIYLQKLVGYSLTGEIREQILIIIYGTGANGKSTFIEAIRELLGDYAQKTSIEALLLKRISGGNTPHIARMNGARFLTASEIPNGKCLDETQIKELTGGDKITATAKYQHPIEFKPTFKIWLIGNHKPPVQDKSPGFWRRIRVIPFDVTIPESEQVPMNELLDSFREEASGILNWAVQGCLKWQIEGLKPPEAVVQATNEYRSEYDKFQGFLNQETESHPDLHTKKSEVYTRFIQWAKDSGEHELAGKSQTWVTSDLPPKNRSKSDDSIRPVRRQEQWQNGRYFQQSRLSSNCGKQTCCLDRARTSKKPVVRLRSVSRLTIAGAKSMGA